jgi:hypothetical protein
MLLKPKLQTFRYCQPYLAITLKLKPMAQTLPFSVFDVTGKTVVVKNNVTDRLPQCNPMQVFIW